jgi:tripartite-type tricarboxylate transporter receptor subunit TctC
MLFAYASVLIPPAAAAITHNARKRLPNEGETMSTPSAARARRFPFSRPLSIFLVFLSAMPLFAQAETRKPSAVWPDHPIRLIAPFHSGGPTELVAKFYADLLSGALKQPIRLENHGGVDGQSSAEMVAHAPADGYTLLFGTVGTQVIAPILNARMTYNPETDFRPIALIASAPIALVAAPSLKIASIGELATLARVKSLRFASSGNGTTGHLTGELFRAASGIPLVHAPHQGSPLAMRKILSGEIDLLFIPLQTVLPYIHLGKLKLLALSAPSPLLPNAPTFASIGVPVETLAWWGVFAPAGTPERVIAQLTYASERALKTQAAQQLEQMGVTLFTHKYPAQITRFMVSEREKWTRALHPLKISPHPETIEEP